MTILYKMLWYVVLGLLGVVPFIYLGAQVDFPDNGVLYNDTLLPRVDIWIDAADLENIFDDVWSNTEYPATFAFSDGTHQDTVQQVGFRLRGSSSRVAAKKSFKISFNTFEQGRKYRGVEKINLNGEHNDPSVMRSKICWDMLRRLRVPAPRANHVLLYINDTFYGVYINVEHIDENFVASRFGNNDGNLYKCTYPAAAEYLGNNPQSYMNAGYELKITGETPFEDVIQFTKTLQDSEAETMECDLSELLNTESYLRAAAFEVMAAHWDAPLFNRNNFYLYHNTRNNRLEYIPYDTDNTFGIDWFNIDWAARNIYDWDASNDPMPFYEALINNAQMKAKYTQHIRFIADSLFNNTDFIADITQRRDMIAPFIEQDDFYTYDYGFTPQDFLDSYSTALGAHVKAGLFQYIGSRANSALAQTQNLAFAPVVEHIRHSAPLPAEWWEIAFNITAHQAALQSVQLQYQINNGAVQILNMYDDGIAPDQVAADGEYRAQVQMPAANALFTAHISVSDAAGNVALLPCNKAIEYDVQTPPFALYINEWQAQNNTVISDEQGEYEDWIELYNPTEAVLSLENVYLTDNFFYPNKWRLPPNLQIQPKNFALFWADDETSEGAQHCNFKLSKEGEELAIFLKQNNKMLPLHKVRFGEQTADHSEGLYPDAADSVAVFEVPTPAASNVGAALALSPVSTDAIECIYPNPAVAGEILYVQLNTADTQANITLYDLQGKAVWRTSIQNKNNALRLPVGLSAAPYYLQAEIRGANGFYQKNNYFIILR